jgi:hypothetical protein
LSFKDQKFIEEALTTFAEDTHAANMIEDGGGTAETSDDLMLDVGSVSLRT